MKDNGGVIRMTEAYPFNVMLNLFQYLLFVLLTTRS
jgi:hypothetical protein